MKTGKGSKAKHLQGKCLKLGGKKIQCFSFLSLIYYNTENAGLSFLSTFLFG